MEEKRVSVLAPNGRRQILKCNPNTTIIQIIEDVCKKQGYAPNEHDVKHHNKVLDSTMTLRFSGLPNNAQLELVPALKARQDAQITVRLDLESGEKRMGDFMPDIVLWTVITQLCPEESLDKHPVIIYTRKEITGTNLTSTTLKSLGLRGGRVAMSLIHREPEKIVTQANVSAPLPSKPAEEKPYHRVLIPSNVDEQMQKISQGDNAPNIPESVENECVNPPKPSVQKKTETDFLRLAREKRKLENSSESENKPKKSEVGVENSELMEVDTDNNKQNQESSDTQFMFLGQRNALLFSLETAKTVPPEELPDEFFELTINDAKKIINDIRKNRQKTENLDLKTSAMRELEESKKQLRRLNKYTRAVIRVQFPDRIVLQGTFTPTETIADVLSFVVEYLDENKSNDIHLYTTPPKQILSKELKLIEADCVPGALLYLGSNSCSSSDLVLKNGLIDNLTSNSMASLAASKTRIENTRNINEESSDEEELVDETQSRPDYNAPGVPGPSNHGAERKVESGGAKVPKWFKSK